MKRRTFIAIVGAAATGGLVLGYRAWSDRYESRARALTTGADETLICGWVKIAKDDTVTVYVPHVDMGQGSHTALAMMLADELDADWSRVRVDQAPADAAFANRFLAEGWTLQDQPFPKALDGVVDLTFTTASRLIGLQQTGGSTAVRMTGQVGMRVIGAAARTMLMRTAARRWNVSADELHTTNSVVHHEPSGRAARYWELVEEAATLSAPATPKLKSPSDFRLIGKSVPRLDIPPKVTGEFRYGIDLTLPEMRYAAAKSAPVHGGRLVTVNAANAKAVDGVEHVVPLESSVAVIARSYWAATQGLAALDAKFSTNGNDRVSTASIYEQQAQRLQRVQSLQSPESHPASDSNSNSEIDFESGDPHSVLAAAPPERVIEREYRVPFLHHAAMEPINITAQFRDGHLTVWAGEQSPLETRTALIELSGLDASRVEFKPLPIGGSFGRRAGPGKEYLTQAIELARKSSPHPVKLIWSREEDFAQGAYRPQLLTRIRAALAEDGKVLAWSQVYVKGVESKSIAFHLPYSIPHQTIRSIEVPVHIRTGPLRSVNHNQHGFWIESFIDELAHTAGRDPLAYRRAMLEPDSRHDRVLAAVAEKSQWSRTLPAGVGRGVALCECYGSIVAHVVEASVAADGAPLVHRVVAAVDCGDICHPDTATQQVESAILMGLSGALAEQITIERGAVIQTGFANYPVMTLARTPAIEVHFLRSAGAWGGLGEPGLPPAAPALANALFTATGRRARTLPLISGAST